MKEDQQPARDDESVLDQQITEYLLARDDGKAASHPNLGDHGSSELRSFVQGESLLTGLSESRNDDAARELKEKFGDFEVFRRIGQGGMGSVYHARHTPTGQPVALKIMRRRLADSSEGVKRFLRERRAARSLEHENVVPVVDVGECDGRLWFSMELIDGPDFSEVAAAGETSPLQAAIYVRKIADAVHYIHGSGVIHRDLKPSNVLLDVYDEPRITDFGLARVEQDNEALTRRSATLGSPQYMSPEQARRSHQLIGERTDLYGIGTILYELLSGQPPAYQIPGESTRLATRSGDALRRLINGTLVPPHVHSDHVPPELELICLKCLAKEPADRFETASDLAEALGQYIASQSDEDIDVGRARGDKEYLGELLESYQNDLRFMASRLPINARRKVGASDITQNTLADAYKSMHQFRGKTRREFQAWLRKIQRGNIARELRRAATKEGGLPAPGPDQSTPAAVELPGSIATPSQWCMRVEQWQKVDQLLRQLSEREREAIVLRYAEGLTLAEISERLGVKYDAVSGRLRRGLQRLREAAASGADS